MEYAIGLAILFIIGGLLNDKSKGKLSNDMIATGKTMQSAGNQLMGCGCLIMIIIVLIFVLIPFCVSMF